MTAYFSLSHTEDQEAVFDKAKLLFLDNHSFVKGQRKTDQLNLDTLPTVQGVADIRYSIAEGRARLQRYSLDDIIAFLSAASKEWLQPGIGLEHLHQHGLSFLVNWFNAPNLRSLADQSLNNQRVILDDFVVDQSTGTRMIKAVPRGIVGHWLAGNVPLLGMLGYAQALLTKNANIIKVPSNNSVIMPLLLEKMATTKVRLQNGVEIDGADITASTAVIYYDRNDIKTANAVSGICDVRIAWGGAEAVVAVMNLEKKLGAEDIVFGPKLSFMVIDSQALSPDQNLNKLFRRIATDCSVFDQYACASPHNVFVERSSYLSPETFCAELASAMGKMSHRIPKAAVDAGTASQILEKRLEFEFRGKLWSSADTTWTVLLRENQNVTLADPTYSRVVNVLFVDDVMDVAELVNEDIQTISLAMTTSNKLKFANRAADLGAVRFPDVGRMTHFEAPWDGVFPMERLVKFCTLGGPLV